MSLLKQFAVLIGIKFLTFADAYVNEAAIQEFQDAMEEVQSKKYSKDGSYRIVLQNANHAAFRLTTIGHPLDKIEKADDTVVHDSVEHAGLAIMEQIVNKGLNHPSNCDSTCDTTPAYRWQNVADYFLKLQFDKSLTLPSASNKSLVTDVNDTNSPSKPILPKIDNMPKATNIKRSLINFHILVSGCAGRDGQLGMVITMTAIDLLIKNINDFRMKDLDYKKSKYDFKFHIHVIPAHWNEYWALEEAVQNIIASFNKKFKIDSAVSAEITVLKNLGLRGSIEQLRRNHATVKKEIIEKYFQQESDSLSKTDDSNKSDSSNYLLSTIVSETGSNSLYDYQHSLEYSDMNNDGESIRLLQNFIDTVDGIGTIGGSYKVLNKFIIYTSVSPDFDSNRMSSVSRKNFYNLHHKNMLPYLNDAVMKLTLIRAIFDNDTNINETLNGVNTNRDTSHDFLSHHDTNNYIFEDNDWAYNLIHDRLRSVRKSLPLRGDGSIDELLNKIFQLKGAALIQETDSEKFKLVEYFLTGLIEILNDKTPTFKRDNSDIPQDGNTHAGILSKFASKPTQEDLNMENLKALISDIRSEIENEFAKKLKNSDDSTILKQDQVQPKATYENCLVKAAKSEDFKLKKALKVFEELFKQNLQTRFGYAILINMWKKLELKPNKATDDSGTSNTTTSDIDIVTAGLSQLSIKVNEHANPKILVTRLKATPNSNNIEYVRDWNKQATDLVRWESANTKNNSMSIRSQKCKGEKKSTSESLLATCFSGCFPFISRDKGKDASIPEADYAHSFAIYFKNRNLQSVLKTIEAILGNSVDVSDMKDTLKELKELMKKLYMLTKEFTNGKDSAKSSTLLSLNRTNSDSSDVSILDTMTPLQLFAGQSLAITDTTRPESQKRKDLKDFIEHFKATTIRVRNAGNPLSEGGLTYTDPKANHWREIKLKQILHAGSAYITVTKIIEKISNIHLKNPNHGSGTHNSSKSKTLNEYIADQFNGTDDTSKWALSVAIRDANNTIFKENEDVMHDGLPWEESNANFAKLFNESNDEIRRIRQPFTWLSSTETSTIFDLFFWFVQVGRFNNNKENNLRIVKQIMIPFMSLENFESDSYNSGFKESEDVIEGILMDQIFNNINSPESMATALPLTHVGKHFCSESQSGFSDLHMSKELEDMENLKKAVIGKNVLNYIVNKDKNSEFQDSADRDSKAYRLWKLADRSWTIPQKAEFYIVAIAAKLLDLSDFEEEIK